MLSILKLLFEIVNIMFLALLEKGLFDDREEMFKSYHKTRIKRRIKKCRKVFDRLENDDIENAENKGKRHNNNLKKSADK